jgi:hypothetical protein
LPFHLHFVMVQTLDFLMMFFHHPKKSLCAKLN